MGVRVKICGITTRADAESAVAAGADAIGLNFVAGSPRRVPSYAAALAVCEAVEQQGVQIVGLFVNPAPVEILAALQTVPLTILQLHGEESCALGESLRVLGLPLWKAYRVASAADLRKITAEEWPCDALLLDSSVPGGARGGTGQTFDWKILAGWKRPRPLILAGGLNAANVAAAVRAVQPDWVDTASGVESVPGTKDAARMRAFVSAAKQALAE